MIWIDDETATLDFSSEDARNQCLNLLQNENQNFRAKRTLVDDFCLMGEETTMNIDFEARMEFQRKAQVGRNGCIPNATGECKAAALEYVHHLAEMTNDENLKECYNKTMIGKGSKFTKLSRSRNREMDFLLLHGFKDHMNSIIDIFTKTCQPFWLPNIKMLENYQNFN